MWETKRWYIRVSSTKIWNHRNQEDKESRNIYENCSIIHYVSVIARHDVRPEGAILPNASIRRSRCDTWEGYAIHARKRFLGNDKRTVDSELSGWWSISDFHLQDYAVSPHFGSIFGTKSSLHFFSFTQGNCTSVLIIGYVSHSSLGSGWFRVWSVWAYSTQGWLRYL